MLRRSQTRAHSQRVAELGHLRTRQISPAGTNALPDLNSANVVDLTCEDNDDIDLYIDLTSLDTTSVVIMDTPPATTTRRPRGRRDFDVNSTRQMTPESPMLLSDTSDTELEDLPPLPFPIKPQVASPSTRSAIVCTSASTPTSGIVCPVCLDGVNEIKANGRHLMATTCGHVFCSQCVRGILASRDGPSRCPSCRKKLTARNVHQLFI